MSGLPANKNRIVKITHDSISEFTIMLCNAQYKMISATVKTSDTKKVLVNKTSLSS